MDRKKVKEAKRKPYKILDARKPILPKDIIMDTCERHNMSHVLQAKETRLHHGQMRPLTTFPQTTRERMPHRVEGREKSAVLMKSTVNT